MFRLKKLIVAFLITGLFCASLPLSAFATPLTQIEEGQKCKELNQTVEEGIWAYKCTKVRKKKLWQLNGMSSAFTSTTTTTTTTTIPPTTTVPSAPAAPTGLTLTIKSPFDGTGTIRWTDNSSNEDNFYISNIDPSKLGSTSLSSIWFKGAANVPLVNVTGYQNGFSYCYWVMASNSSGNSAWVGPSCAMAGTSTTTTTAYVPPSSGSSSSTVNSYSISGYVDSSYVSLRSSWNSLLHTYSISGYIDNSYVSARSSWNSLLQRYSISGTGSTIDAAILAAVVIPPK